MSEIENGRLGLHGTGQWKCNHLTTLGFKWLKPTHSLGNTREWIDRRTDRTTVVTCAHAALCTARRAVKNLLFTDVVAL